MIKLENTNTGLIKECPTGFSATTLLFGFFVPAARGMYGYAAIWMVAGLLTVGISWLVLPFTINKAYIKHLMEKGYKPESEEDVKKIQSMGIPYKPRPVEQPKAA